MLRSDYLAISFPELGITVDYADGLDICALDRALIGSTALIDQIRLRTVPLSGVNLSPNEAWLVTRSLLTLEVRMRAHTEAVDFIAGRLQGNAGIRKIHRPGLSGPLSETMSGAGGLATFEFTPDVNIRLSCNALRTVALGVSWGLRKPRHACRHCSARTDCGPNAMSRFGVPASFLRLFVGLEGQQVVLDDLENAISIAGMGDPSGGMKPTYFADDKEEPQFAKGGEARISRK